MNDRERTFLGFSWVEWAIATCIFIIVAIPISRYLLREEFRAVEQQSEAWVGPVGSGIVATLSALLWLGWAWSKGLDDAKKRGLKIVRPWVLLLAGTLLAVAAVLFYLAV